MTEETARHVRHHDPQGMRIALVTETWHPEINGVAHTLGKLVSGLVRHGHQVELIRPRQKDSDRPGSHEGVEEILVRGLPIPMYPSLRIGLPSPGQLRRQWNQRPPDLVHIATEGPLGLAALHAARALDIAVSSSFHSNFDSYSDHYGYGWIRGAVTRYLRTFHNRTQLTLVPTRKLAGDLVHAGYQNVDVLARGVDTGLFNPARRSHALRVEWGARPETLVALHVGRLAPEKNLDLVLQAFAAIRQRNPGALLVFVGDGPSRRQLQRCHPQHIYAGMRTGIDLATHYASADLFLFPSMTETYGNVTQEALASGLPVVAYDMAAAAELVHCGHNGQLASTGDSRAFVAAGITVAAALRKHNPLRLNARQSVTESSWETVQDRFTTMLGHLWRAYERRRNFESGLIMVPD